AGPAGLGDAFTELPLTDRRAAAGIERDARLDRAWRPTPGPCERKGAGATRPLAPLSLARGCGLLGAVLALHDAGDLVVDVVERALHANEEAPAFVPRLVVGVTFAVVKLP